MKNPISDIPDIGSLQELTDALSIAMMAGIRILTSSGKPLVRDNRYSSFYREIFRISPTADSAYGQFITELCAWQESAVCVRHCPVTGLTDALVRITLEEVSTAYILIPR